MSGFLTYGILQSKRIRPFEITIDTTEAGSDPDIMVLPIQGDNMVIDWGDGNVDRNVSTTGVQDITHQYSTPGEYTIGIRGITQIQFNDGGDKEKLLFIDQWGDAKWVSMQSAFFGCSNMQGRWADTPDLSNVTIMLNMFRSCLIFNYPLNDWNVSSVTNMTRMFFNTVFNQNIGNWDVSSVTVFEGVFMNSDFNNGGSPDINNWDVSNVTNMSSMFRNSNFNQPVEDWDVSSVNNMGIMFSGTPFNQNIGGWDVSNVTNMSLMFSGASSFNQDIGGWDVSNVTSFVSFLNSTSFNNDGSDSIKNWNVSSAVNMQRMFNGTPFNQPIGDWNVSNVTDMSFMFRNSDFNQDISDWDISNVNNFEDFMLGKNSLNYSPTFLANIYDKWSQLSVQPDIEIDFGDIEYDAFGQTGKDILEDVPNNWVITDGGSI